MVGCQLPPLDDSCHPFMMPFMVAIPKWWPLFFMAGIFNPFPISIFGDIMGYPFMMIGMVYGIGFTTSFFGFCSCI